MFVKNKILLPIFLLFSLSASLKAGVILLTEPPQEVIHIIAELQKKAQAIINKINAHDSKKYFFDIPQYDQHISLAYITREELPLKAILEKAPTVHTILQNTGKHLKPIDLTPHLKDAKIVCYKGDQPNSYKGVPKKNYYYIVLELTDSSEFTFLTQSLYGNLKHLSFKELAPSGRAHLTIGKLFEEKDQIPYEITKTLTNGLAKDVQEMRNFIYDKMWVIGSFTLKGHDRKLLTFPLSQS
jgi:hypothetical protein